MVTGSAWTVFLVFLFALTALQEKHPKLKPAMNRHIETKQASRTSSESKPTLASYSPSQSAAPTQEAELTLEKRQKIYEMAVHMRYHIESAEEQRRELKAKGFNVSRRDEQIDRQEVDQIVAEGDRNDWPTR